MTNNPYSQSTKERKVKHIAHHSFYSATIIELWGFRATSLVSSARSKLLQRPFVALQDRGRLFLSTKTTAAGHQSYTRDDRLRSNLPLGYLSRNLASVVQKPSLPVPLIHAIDASSIGDKENHERRESLELENSSSAPLFQQQTSPQNTGTRTTVRKDQSELNHMGNASIKLIISNELVGKSQDTNDTCWLQFALPEGRELLGEHPTLLTCISVKYNAINESGEPVVLKKSCLPILHPNQKGTLDLLVKSIRRDREGCRGLSLRIKRAGRLNPSGRQTK
jgi:hypothetical protein